MAPTANKIRVRLSFEMPPPLPLSPHSKCYMFLINRSEMSCVADVEHAIAVKFGYSNTKSLVLSIGKFVLLSNEDVDVIRENDEITVGVEDSVAFLDLISLPGTNSVGQIGSVTDALVSIDSSKTKKRSGPQTHSSKKAKKKCKLGATNLDLKKKKGKHKKVKRKAKESLSKPNKINDILMKQVETGTSNRISVLSNLTVSEEHCSTETTNEETAVGPEFRFTSSTENTDNDQIPGIVEMLDVEPVIVKEEVTENRNAFTEKFGVRTRSSWKSETPPVVEQSPDSPIGPVCDCYDELTILSWPPRIGDLIAYKEFEMTDNYTPAISGFREAKVLEISESKPGDSEKNLHVKIMWPKTITLANVKGKFDLDYESEVPVENNSDSRKKLLSWATLIDPRLIK